MVDLAEKVISQVDTSNDDGVVEKHNGISTVSISTTNEEVTSHSPAGGATSDPAKQTTDAATARTSLHAVILASLPLEYRNMLGSIGFVPWRNNKLPDPVLIVSPLNAPRLVRDQWLDIYHKKKESGDLSQMSYLVYWYGATERDTRMYGFVTPRTFIPFEVEKAKVKSACQLPKRIQCKVDASATTTTTTTTLSAKDASVWRRYREMEDDLRLHPSERQRGLPYDFAIGGNTSAHLKKKKRAARDIDPNDWRAVKSHQRRQCLS